MNLKEIIIEELEREFFGNNELHQYDKDRIEQTANNIISKMDWQVIASGVVNISGEYESQHLRFYDKNRKPKYKRLTYEDFTEYEGKDIEIIVKIK